MTDRPNPLVQLTLWRIREFTREPEALFWVFAFPIVLAFALGLAFKSRGARGGLGAAPVKPRNQKLLKRRLASPMKRRPFMLSHLRARLVFLTLEVVSLLL